MTEPEFRRQWRFYRTAAGASPVHDYLSGLDTADRARVRLAMLAVTREGRAVARHVHDDVYEVRAGRTGRAWRVLFAAEGRYNHVLLALSAFEKKTQQTPQSEIERAEARLRDWRNRGRSR
ncbi:MAG: type II toxin-antitoxin system RelE/ParE family toxin [Acidimicrobiales bacterium]